MNIVDTNDVAYDYFEQSKYIGYETWCKLQQIKGRCIVNTGMQVLAFSNTYIEGKGDRLTLYLVPSVKKLEANKKQLVLSYFIEDGLETLEYCELEELKNENLKTMGIEGKQYVRVDNAKLNTEPVYIPDGIRVYRKDVKEEKINEEKTHLSDILAETDDQLEELGEIVVTDTYRTLIPVSKIKDYIFGVNLRKAFINKANLVAKEKNLQIKYFSVDTDYRSGRYKLTAYLYNENEKPIDTDKQPSVDYYPLESKVEYKECMVAVGTIDEPEVYIESDLNIESEDKDRLLVDRSIKMKTESGRELNGHLTVHIRLKQAIEGNWHVLDETIENSVYALIESHNGLFSIESSVDHGDRPVLILNYYKKVFYIDSEEEDTYEPNQFELLDKYPESVDEAIETLKKAFKANVSEYDKHVEIRWNFTDVATVKA